MNILFQNKYIHILVFLSMAFNYQIITIGGKNVYLINITILLIAIINIFVSLIRKRIKIDFNDRIAFFIVLYYLVIITVSEDKNAAISSFALFMLIFLTFFSVKNYIDDITYVFKLYLIMFFILSVRVIVTNYDKFFTINIHNRYDIPYISGFNNFASLLSIAIIIAIVLIENKPIKFGVISLFFVLLLFSLSRGGLVTLTTGILYLTFSKYKLFKKKRNIVLTLFLVIIFSFIFYNKVEHGTLEVLFQRYQSMTYDSSGRTVIWSYIIKGMFSDLKSFFMGRGPGTFEFTGFGIIQDSTHNEYLSIFYQFGFIGLFFASIYLVHLLLKVRSTCDCKEKTLLIGTYIMLITSALFDSHLWIPQTNWIFGYLLALTYKYFNYSKNLK